MDNGKQEEDAISIDQRIWPRELDKEDLKPYLYWSTTISY